VVSGVCSGSVNPGVPSCGNTVIDRGNVEVPFRASVSCSRLEGEGERGKDSLSKGGGPKNALSASCLLGHQITKKSSH
jgi:hypothetical protein